ncbi:MCE family protein [Nocardioides pelophilus]|uniref:MCE family protein n=1 Tax=Nocardioides pelophilus TaxID=2172019 RepID=UPI001603AEBA|nr:MlaD family protein [Nocardioides pelophilus]
MSRRSVTVSAAVKLSVFLLAAAAVTLTVAGTIRPIGSGGNHEYHAILVSASDLKPGDQVRVAGVVVGRVSDVALDPDGHARISFTVDEELDLTTETRAEIRYLNLIGNRYLALSEGRRSSEAEVLTAGGTIPVERTSPALDLDQLFTGFKPLFAALSPDDANALAADLVATFQGEGGTIRSLLSHTAEVTSNLADRDAVVGRVVENLTTTLQVVDANQVGLNQLVTQLGRYVGGLAADRRVLGGSLEGIADLAGETASLLDDARPALRSDIDRLADLVAMLDTPTNRALVDEALRVAPPRLARITRVASYGSWFNFYLCDLGLDVQGAGGGGTIEQLLGDIEQITIHDTSPRCRP